MSYQNVFISQFNSSFLFGTFIDHFVVKSISPMLYLHFLQKVFFMEIKTKYLISFHFGSTSYNYLYALVKKTISLKKQMLQVKSESDLVIWLLLPEFVLVQVPILSLRLLEYLMLTLQNLQHKLISSHISTHPNLMFLYTFKVGKVSYGIFFFFFFFFFVSMKKI